MPSFTETSHQGFGSRIFGAIKGILFGGLLFLGGIAGLFWNEGRAVDALKDVAEARGALVSVSADTPEQANDGKLVHLSGNATTEDTVSDALLNYEAIGIRLTRTVEMYQWEENERTRKQKKMGGGEETITEYSYEEVWSEALIDSTRFNSRRDDNTGMQIDNPEEKPIDSESSQAARVTLGGFTLSSRLVGQINNPEKIALTEANLPEQFAATMKVNAGSLYLGENPGSPQIGDCRVTLTITNPADVSVVAKQKGETFEAYVAGHGKEFERLDMGTKSATEMMDEIQAEEEMFTWIIRAVGVIAIFVGLMLLARPIIVVADILPFVGNIAEAGFAIIAGLIAVAVSSLTIGVAWLFYRPLIGAPMLVLSGGLLFVAWKRTRKSGPSSGRSLGTADDHDDDDWGA